MKKEIKETLLSDTVTLFRSSNTLTFSNTFKDELRYNYTMNIHTFRAFQSRNYRLFFAGQSVSLMETWMQRTAVYWVIYMQTHSAFILGLSVFASQFPSFLLSLLGGAIADRYNRFKVLLFTQFASMLQAIVVTLIVIFTDYSVVELIVLSILLGIINAFDVPARHL